MRGKDKLGLVEVVVALFRWRRGGVRDVAGKTVRANSKKRWKEGSRKGEVKESRELGDRTGGIQVAAKEVCEWSSEREQDRDRRGGE